MATPYVPALGYRWLTGLYDPVVALTTREATFKRALLDQAALAPGQRVLDLACGTATLTIAARQREPALEISGLDGDPEILGIARAKAARAGIAIGFDQGLSTQLPYADASFDRVLCSLFFHHLSPADKQASLAEIARVLKPGGELHVADWGRAANPLLRFAFLGIQLLDGFATTADSVAGRLPEYMRQAGFAQVAQTRHFATVFGSLCLYRAVRPA